MGQAKQRGTAEQRAEQAKQRIEALKPDVIVCNDCETETHDIAVLDTRGMRGLEAAFAGICPKCQAVTYAYRGAPEAILKFSEFMAAEMGGNPMLGIQTTSGRIR